MEIASMFYVLEEFKDERPQKKFMLFNGGYGKIRLSLFIFLLSLFLEKKISKHNKK